MPSQRARRRINSLETTRNASGDALVTGMAHKTYQPCPKNRLIDWPIAPEPMLCKGWSRMLGRPGRGMPPRQGYSRGMLVDF